MTQTDTLNDSQYRRELGDDLVLRWSVAEDVERIAALYSHVFRPNADKPPNERIAHWTRDLMSGRHPLCGPGDFAVVEDTRSKEIVASTCLIDQVWDYDGIAFDAGRPEIVASLPGYRNRGLVRAVFELIHARSAARAQLALGITGIPYYYRLFGYEYALDLGGSRSIPFSDVPKLKDGADEPYRLRDATADDLPFVRRLYDQERAGTQGDPVLVSTQIPDAYWRWQFDGLNPESGEGWRMHIVEDDSPRGIVLTRLLRWDNALTTFSVSVEPDVPLVTALPSILRGLQAIAEETPALRPDIPPAARLSFMLGRSHPVYDALGDRLSGHSRPPYAWYVRVPDLPRFVSHVAPALHRRLSQSVAANYTGEIRLDFYRAGLRLAFEHGRLTAAEDWRSAPWGPEAQGGFPPLVFLQLLFGHRSLHELRDIFPDVWASDDAAPVLESLFPRQRSWVVPLD